MANAALADLKALQHAADLSRPVTLAKDNVLPVPDAFIGLLPDGGLRRGSTVTINGKVGSTSLALSLIAEASKTGSWTAVIAMPWLGLIAADEYGIDISRVAVVDEPGDQWATVVAAMVGAFDVVLTGPPKKVRGSDGRRLAARMRERGTVLVQVDNGWSHSAGFVTGDLTLTTGKCEWNGLQDGHGRLTSRRVEVSIGGRGAAGRGGSTWFSLPNNDGEVDSLAPPPVVSISSDRLIGSVEDVAERLRHLTAVPGLEAG